MNKEIVVAAYDKPLDWLIHINESVKKTIYRKGHVLPVIGEEIFIDNNVGRDVHTFFYHIFANYNNLADVTYFAQDYPFDHWGNLIEIVNGDYIDLQKCELKIDGYYGFHNNTLGTAWVMPPSKQFSNGYCLECLSDGYPHDSVNGIDVDYYWNILFEQIPPKAYEFIPGGHFAITKNQALIRNKEFYQKVCELLETNKNAPWIFERLECYIFSKNYSSKF